MDTINIPGVESDWMTSFCFHILVCEEVVGHLWGAGHLTGSLEAKDQEIQNQATVLHDEGGELETTNDPVRVCVVHVLQQEATVEH